MEKSKTFSWLLMRDPVAYYLMARKDPLGRQQEKKVYILPIDGYYHYFIISVSDFRSCCFGVFMTKANVMIFIDSSYNPGRKLGVAGFLCIPNCPDEVPVNKNVSEEWYSPDAVKTRIVENTTNTRLELQTLLWALESLKSDNETKTSGEMGSITIYTDCRTAVDLLRRRKRLESVHYLSKRKGTTLGNADIYKSIFALYDELSPKFVWIKGHTSKKDRVGIQRIFSEVDRFVRRSLRNYIARTCS